VSPAPLTEYVVLRSALGRDTHLGSKPRGMRTACGQRMTDTEVLDPAVVGVSCRRCRATHMYQMARATNGI
jgi:hypothetical protein